MTDYGDGVLSDAQIAAMSPAQRRDLIQRLERALDEVFPPAIARRMRRNRLTLMVGGADIMTAGPGQFWLSLLTAALINLPLAAIMITGAVRIVRLTATRLWFLDPETPAWRLPLVP